MRTLLKAGVAAAVVTAVVAMAATSRRRTTIGTTAGSWCSRNASPAILDGIRQAGARSSRTGATCRSPSSARSLRSTLTIPPGGYLIGHPAWRNEPSHLSVREGKTVRVTNKGGRGHTFTEVAEFGGGFVAQLNIGLNQAPEWSPATTIPLPPGATVAIRDLEAGLHKFECCIHPWMRATIQVHDGDHHGHT